MSWLRRLTNALRPGRVERDIAREVSFHIAERTDELRAGGLSEQEAARRARARVLVPQRAESHTHISWFARTPNPWRSPRRCGSG
jgi:hypothetical protein